MASPHPGSRLGSRPVFSCPVGLISFFLEPFLGLFSLCNLDAFEGLKQFILWTVSHFGYVWCFLRVRLRRGIWGRNRTEESSFLTDGEGTGMDEVIWIGTRGPQGGLLEVDGYILWGMWSSRTLLEGPGRCISVPAWRGRDLLVC